MRPVVAIVVVVELVVVVVIVVVAASVAPEVAPTPEVVQSAARADPLVPISAQL